MPVVAAEGSDSSPAARSGAHFKDYLLLSGAALLAMAVFLTALAVSGPHTGTDFICFYSAGKTILRGEGAKLYDYSTQLSIQRSFTGHAFPVIGAHAPPEAVLFVPLAHFSYPTAYLIWALVNMVVLAICLYLMRAWLNQLGTWDRLLLLGCTFCPVITEIQHGQDSLLVLLVYVLTFLLLRRRKAFRAGCVLALALVKVELVAPFVFLNLGRRSKRFFAGFVAVAMCLAALSVAIVGFRTTVLYPVFLLGLNEKHNWVSQHQSFPIRMPNLRGLAYALFRPHIPAHPLDLGIAALSVVLLIVAAAARWKCKDTSDDEFTNSFSADLLLTMLFSWYMYLYDLSLLFLPALLLLASTNQAHGESLKSKWLIRISLIAVLVGELAALAQIPQPREFADAAVGLILLIWASDSLLLRRRLPLAKEV